MRSGVISDFTATKAIVRVLLYKVCKNMVFKPNIVVCMPSTVTNLEKRTILDLVTAAERQGVPHRRAARRRTRCGTRYQPSDGHNGH